MGLIELTILALGLSTDAFAVTICAGLSTKRNLTRKSLIIATYFGIFHTIMPIIGYLLAIRFVHVIAAFSPWIAFALLTFLGIKTLIPALKKEQNSCPIEMSFHPRNLFLLAIATSIDTLAVGVSFAFLQVNLLLAAPLIGITAFIISLLGMKLGHLCGTKFKSKAEILGSTILIGIGLYILIEHLVF